MLYRRAIGREVWHYHPACSQWPRTNYQEYVTKPRAEPVCQECVARRQNQSLPISASAPRFGNKRPVLAALWSRLQAAIRRKWR